MTIGEFWSHAVTLCLVYNGTVTTGPCSTSYNALVGREPEEKYVLGLACDIRLRDGRDIRPCMDAATTLGLQASGPKGLSLDIKIEAP